MNWFKRLFRPSASTVTRLPAQNAKNPVPQRKSSAAEMRTRYAMLERPALHLRPASSTRFSKLGGLPRLAAETPWPHWKGKPQAFLAQIDLAEVHSVHPSILPATGQLFFFYDQDQSVWGFDPADRGGWSVIYNSGNYSDATERAAPPDLKQEFIFAEKPVIPCVVNVLPDSQRLPRPEFDWDRDGDAYTAVRDAAFRGMIRHQMLGFPTPVQGDDMELQCQLASNGIYVGDPSGYQHPRSAALEKGADEWKLLLQLDTDDDTGWMWGDIGTIYYWIRESDARRADFSNVWFSYQCC